MYVKNLGIGVLEHDRPAIRSAHVHAAPTERNTPSEGLVNINFKTISKSGAASSFQRSLESLDEGLCYGTADPSLPMEKI